METLRPFWHMTGMTCPHPSADREMRLTETVSHLSETIGERHLGSPGERRTQEFLKDRLQTLGYEVVSEPFPTPGWRYGEHEVRLADGEIMDAAPCYFSPGGEVRAPLKTFWTARDSAGTLEEFAGSVVFAGNYDFAQVADTNALAERLDRAGAAALIINSPYNDTYSTKIVRSPHLKTMLVFTVSQRTALRMAREEGRLVSLRLDAEVFPHESANLVARHTSPGTSRGKLVVGAHYDTSPGIPGAADNASGIAALLEVAEMLQASLDGWDVDFVAFGGEEYGGPGYGIGGYCYWEAHRDEPIRAMMCLDGMGTYLTIPEARVGRSAGLRELVRTHAASSGVRVLPFRRGSDQGIFHDHGIPTVWFCDGGADNGVRHYPLHSPQDAIAIIDFQKLTRLTEDAAAVIAAILRTGIVEPAHANIEEYKPCDSEAIEQLVRAVWTMGADRQREIAYNRILGEPWQDKIAASVREYLGRPDVRVWTITENGRLAGFTSVRIDAGTRLAEIGYNAVDPAFAGQGIGKKLLQWALDFLKSEGCAEIEVVTGMDPGHAPARAIYEGAGFKPFLRSVRYNLMVKAG